MLPQTHMSTRGASIVLIDVQEKLTLKIPRAAQVIRNIGFLLDAAQTLEIPAHATEQYLQGLGPTVPERKYQSFAESDRRLRRAALFGHGCGVSMRGDRPVGGNGGRKMRNEK